MYNISELSKEEIKYICEHMHLPTVRFYFQKNPKEFNKIKPGFTVKKMTDDAILSFLIKYASKPFVQTLIQNGVKQWLSEIQENCASLEKNGFSAGEAILKTFPDCVFCDKIELYFKLIEQEYNDGYLRLFSDALSLIKKSSETATEEYNTEIVNAQIEESNKEITNLKEQLDESKRREEIFQHELDDRNEQLQQYQAKINEANADLHNMDNELSEIRLELNHYHKLERYTEGEVDQSLFSKYQYTSIGQIRYDYNDKRRIFRLADISTNGVITPFVADENKPYCFANRDRLHWYDGPENENAIGIWNWNASPKYTDPEKDFVKTYYCNSISLIQIIEPPNCESLDDVASLLIEGANNSIICDKVLFVLKDGTSFKGLLCSSKDFENTNEIIKLKPSVFTLPQYIIRNIDVIKIASIYIYNNVGLKIPTSIYQIRTPYKAVKSMLLSRITNSAMREYELSKKEVQRCRQFLKAIPTQTLMQELTLAYNCSKEEAQEYIDGFIDHADTYLSSTDLDVNIISRAIQGNAGLLELCKQQLTEEWETENAERLAEAETKIKNIISSIEKKQNELNLITDDKNRLSTEIEQLHSQLSQREQESE